MQPKQELWAFPLLLAACITALLSPPGTHLMLPIDLTGPVPHHTRRA